MAYRNPQSDWPSLNELRAPCRTLAVQKPAAQTKRHVP